ncbi:ABC transporter permease [Apilactobacillus ozensis]|uniref:ABC transporter permease n=1 Tax=Apilactobacillus ozensis TaxID=866801 RepID=UPI00200AC1F1|nr:ABC transporter permease [Apilactobacillus ozensis]MCK8606643.1 ABC transporter permease [Apilactobacillus ozensis]
MKALFSKRLSAHVTEVTGYLKYVLNDFFVIALMFFVGGLALEYSQILKHLNYGMWWIKPLVVILGLLIVQVSHFTTLVQKPDYVFLLPREKDFYSYLKSAYHYSLLMAIPVQIACGIVLVPLINISRNSYDIIGILAYLITFTMLKVSMISFDLLTSYHISKNYLYNKFNIRVAYPTVFLIIAVFLNSYVAVGLVIVLNLFIYHLIIKSKHNPLNWNKIINNENSRMLNVYKFFNMFTDVPQLTTSVKRRSYLSFLMGIFKTNHDNTFSYLYIRGLLRNNEFSGLYIRLSLIGIILLAFIDNKILSIVLSLLFIYLIIFQLIPFYKHFEGNAFVHIYPISEKDKVLGFKKALSFLSYIVLVVFFIASFIGTGSLLYSLLSLILNYLLSLVMVRIYMSKRIMKS